MPTRPAATIDRRVARTRKALQDALFLLMLKKGYEAVTVEDICAAANVGRSTFYGHFTGKEDLKRSSLDDHLRKILPAGRPRAGANDERFGFVLPFLEHTRDHLDLYRALVSKGGAATTLKMVHRIVTEQVRQEVAAEKPLDTATREALVALIAGGFMSLLTWWLDGGARLPVRRVDDIFRRLVTAGVAHCTAHRT